MEYWLASKIILTAFMTMTFSYVVEPKILNAQPLISYFFKKCETVHIFMIKCECDTDVIISAKTDLVTRTWLNGRFILSHLSPFITKLTIGENLFILNKKVVLYANEGGTNEKCWGC